MAITHHLIQRDIIHFIIKLVVILVIVVIVIIIVVIELIIREIIFRQGKLGRFLVLVLVGELRWHLHVLHELWGQFQILKPFHLLKLLKLLKLLLKLWVLTLGNPTTTFWLVIATATLLALALALRLALVITTFATVNLQVLELIVELVLVIVVVVWLWCAPNLCMFSILGELLDESGWVNIARDCDLPLL